MEKIFFSQSRFDYRKNVILYGMKDEENLIPRYTIRRFGLYLYELERLREEGARYVSAAEIATWFGLDPIMTRKELALTGVRGEPRRGFPLEKLYAAIRSILGFDRKRQFYLVGAGNLGHALLADTNKSKINLFCAKAFDCDPGKIGKTIHGTRIYDIKDIARHARKDGIVRAFLAVPAPSAQACLDVLAAAGIRAVLNLAPIALRVPDGVMVENTYLAPYVAPLAYELTRRERKG